MKRQFSACIAERKGFMMNKEQKYTSLEQLPLSLNADDIAEVLNISRGNAYCLMHREDFPTVHIGKRMVVPRNRFFAWMNNQLRSKAAVMILRISLIPERGTIFSPISALTKNRCLSANTVSCERAI